MRRLAASMGIASALAGCSTERGAAEGLDGGADARDAPSEAGDAATTVDLDAILARTLDSLDGAELRAVCSEEARRLDSCREYAFRTTSSTAECETAEARCRRRVEVDGLPWTCGGLRAGSLSGCVVSVDAYLACIADWTEALSCEAAGYRLAAPESCAPLVGACDHLSSSFLIEGKPLPCTADENSSRPPDTNDDIYGLDGCRPPASRFVVLGDSIADCVGTSRERCAPNLIADYLRAHGSPDIAFESHAVSGARVSDLPGQAAQVEGGEGHVLVWMYAVGNDLLSGNFDTDGFTATYEEVFDYFTDGTLFPDGATFLLNTQYILSDECDVPGAKGVLSPDVLALVHDVNQRVFLDVAEARDDCVAIDQYPDFLGHGQNANTRGCPYCGPDNTSWIDDVLHPNAVGHAHMAEKWILALEQMTGAACGTPESDGG